MSETYQTRLKLIEIARRDRGKVEITKNRAPWIEKLWPATDFSDGYADRQPYCAAGVAYCVREWLKLPEVQKAFGFVSDEQVEAWRCKSPAAFGWLDWGRNHAQLLNPHAILHAGDLVVYAHSHIEIVVDDDGTQEGPFTAIGYNTNASGSRDGEGCFEKPRGRAGVKNFIRMLL